MPNLNDWIKAQLKRGYKDKQIKQILASKGYPPSAVAQVDKVQSSTLPSEKLPKKPASKHMTIIVSFIVILILLGLFGLLPFSLNESSVEPLNIEEIYGILVEVNDNEFILDKGGQAITLTHEGLTDDVNIIKVLQDGTISDSSIEELNQGDRVTIAVKIQDDKRIVRAIAIEDLT
jgi:hypothetical protein